jgi:hypothetical protein
MNCSATGAQTMDAVEILMEEYKIHAHELTVQIQLYHRQTQFIQIYGAILISLVALLTKFPSTLANNVASTEQTTQVTTIPSGIALLLLILGATIAFYLVSAAFSSSYTFLILRRRMGEIEEAINDAIGRSGLLKYERVITQTFLEQSYYAPRGIAPHFLSGIFRIAMLGSVIAVLVVLAGHLLPRGTAFLYAWSVMFVAAFMVFEYVKLYSRKGRQLIDAAYTDPHLASRVPFFKYPLEFLISYLAVVSLLYIYTYGGVGSWLNEVFVHGYRPNTFLIGLAIFVYTFLAGTVLPTPSEAPILLFGQSSIPTILIASAFGKGLAAALLMSLTRSGKLTLPERALSFIPSVDDSKRGLFVYFLCQAIPFAPMRSTSLILGAVALRKSTIVKAAVLCALATLIRMCLMWGLISVGAVATSYIIPTK